MITRLNDKLRELPTENAFWALACFFLVAGTVARLAYPPSFNEWIDRDIQRTIGIVAGAHVPLVGPEANNGGFLPGPFLYLLLSPVYAFTVSPYAIGYVNRVLNMVSIALFFLAIRGRYSRFCVLASVGLLSFSVMHASSFGSPINPSFLFILNALMIWFFLKIFVDSEDVYWIPAVITIALGSQIHLSMAIYLLSLVVLALFVSRPRWSVAASSIVCGAICFIPYLVYLHSTSNVALFRSYRQFSPSTSVLQLLPGNTFAKIFAADQLRTAYERTVEVANALSPRLAVHISPRMVSLYLSAKLGIELLIFIAACMVGAWMLLVWGHRLRFRFADNSRHLTLPFLAVLPIVVVWQLSGISRHAHHWYSYVFFPLVPLWIGVSLDVVVKLVRPVYRRVAEGGILAAVVFLGPSTVMFDRTVFYLLDDVVRDVREVKQELGLPLERYRNEVFFVDRPIRGGTARTDAPFEFPPWGLYTDYLYGAVSAGSSAKTAEPGTCYLIAHKGLVDFYSLDYYESRIETLVGARPTMIHEGDRLIFFQYPRPTLGNCLHNTINAWVENERMGMTIARVPQGAQSTIVRDEIVHNAHGETEREMEFAVFDRKAMLPITLQISLFSAPAGTRWRATLRSGQLMAHLNTMRAYSGLFRPWPVLWLNNVRVVLRSGNTSGTLRFGDGPIGQYMLTPLTSVLSPLDQNVIGAIGEVSLSYTTTVAGSYDDGGADIQTLAKGEGRIDSWPTVLPLYRGRW